MDLQLAALQRGFEGLAAIEQRHAHAGPGSTSPPRDDRSGSCRGCIRW
jgi:hypothetical protein